MSLDSKPRVLLGTIRISPVCRLYDRWGKKEAELNKGWVAPDVGGGRAQQATGSDQLIGVEKASDGYEERADVALKFTGPP